MTDLRRRLEAAVGARILLVASDFDGTLSPIVSDPALAAPLEEGVRALGALARLPDTHAAVVSGRALDDLRSRAGVPPGVHLIGGHGTESGSLPGAVPAPERAALRTGIIAALTSVAGTASGLQIEPKPGSVAFHYRNADAAVAARALDRIRALAAGMDGVTVREGKMVIELSFVEGDKGTAIRRLARSLDADTILYIGDDVTDEDAFAVLGESDLGIKVGDGPSRAACRVADPEAVAGLLARVLALRTERTG